LFAPVTTAADMVDQGAISERARDTQTDTRYIFDTPKTPTGPKKSVKLVDEGSWRVFGLYGEMNYFELLMTQNVL